MENDWKKRLGVVYSTNPDFAYEEHAPVESETLPPDKQKLYVSRDRKNRRGKTATLVEGFVGSKEELKRLARTLKSKCGVGGSVSGGEILIQGDFRDKLIDLLRKEGYQVKQKGG